MQIEIVCLYNLENDEHGLSGENTDMIYDDGEDTFNGEALESDSTTYDESVQYGPYATDNMVT